jgi:hypothetical protein
MEEHFILVDGSEKNCVLIREFKKRKQFNRKLLIEKTDRHLLFLTPTMTSQLLSIVLFYCSEHWKKKIAQLLDFRCTSTRDDGKRWKCHV